MLEKKAEKSRGEEEEKMRKKKTSRGWGSDLKSSLGLWNMDFGLGLGLDLD